MASVTKNKQGKDQMADEERDGGEIVRRPDRNAEGGNDGGRGGAGAVAQGQGGFFSIYKKGQGYWTRMLTAGGALFILLWTAQFIYDRVLATVGSRDVRLGVTGAFLVGTGILIWWIINRPTSTDFLIATDSEMKKVNWTSREELIGSTRVVIFFMFLIAIILFGIDILFGYFFYWIHVLHFPPI